MLYWEAKPMNVRGHMKSPRGADRLAEAGSGVRLAERTRLGVATRGPSRLAEEPLDEADPQ